MHMVDDKNERWMLNYTSTTEPVKDLVHINWYTTMNVHKC
jgi:hypothetical protein